MRVSLVIAALMLTVAAPSAESLFRMQLPSPLLVAPASSGPGEPDTEDPVVEEPETWEPLELELRAMPPARAAGQSWVFGTTATGGKPPLVWSMVQHTAGGSFAIDPASGTISGTSLMPGSFDFTLRVTDGNGDYREQGVTASFTTASAAAYSVNYIVDAETTGDVVNASSAKNALTDLDDNTHVVLRSGDSVTYRFDRLVSLTTIGRLLRAVCTGNGDMAFRTMVLGQGGEEFQATTSSGSHTCGTTSGGSYGFYQNGYGVKVVYDYMQPDMELHMLRFR